jgi:hypothetical protein
MYQRTLPRVGVAAPLRSGPGPSPVASPLLLCLGIGVASAALVFSNPGPTEFEMFAAEQLVEVVEAEVCHGDALPGLVRLALSDCPRLVQSQRPAIGSLVGRHSRRIDLGMASIYRTDLGGGTLLGWPLPRFRAAVLAVAGQFVILQAGIDSADGPGQPKPR